MPARDALPRTVPQSKTLIKKLHGKEQDDETLDYRHNLLGDGRIEVDVVCTGLKGSIENRCD